MIYPFSLLKFLIIFPSFFFVNSPFYFLLKFPFFSQKGLLFFSFHHLRCPVGTVHISTRSHTHTHTLRSSVYKDQLTCGNSDYVYIRKYYHATKDMVTGSQRSLKKKNSPNRNIYTASVHPHQYSTLGVKNCNTHTQQSHLK